MKVLITGFTPFGAHEVNPSEMIVKGLAAGKRTSVNTDIMPVVLETSYEKSARELEKQIMSFNPDAIVSFGLAAGSEEIRLERFALNIDDSENPDNDGVIYQGKRIIEDGPDAYRNTLPLELIHKSLTDRSFPVRYSNNAGTYVCNHVFFNARHLIEINRMSCSCGFVHIPAPILDKKSSPSIKYSDLEKAADLIIQSVCQSL